MKMFAVMMSLFILFAVPVFSRIETEQIDISYLHNWERYDFSDPENELETVGQDVLDQYVNFMSGEQNIVQNLLTLGVQSSGLVVGSINSFMCSVLPDTVENWLCSYHDQELWIQLINVNSEDFEEEIGLNAFGGYSKWYYVGEEDFEAIINDVIGKDYTIFSFYYHGQNERWEIRRGSFGFLNIPISSYIPPDQANEILDILFPEEQ